MGSKNPDRQTEGETYGASLQLLKNVLHGREHFSCHVWQNMNPALYYPISNLSPVEWKHTSSPRTKKFKGTPSAGKVMVTGFWDSAGALHVLGKRAHSDSYPILRDLYTIAWINQEEKVRISHRGRYLPLRQRTSPPSCSRNFGRTSSITLPTALTSLLATFNLFLHFEEDLVALPFASDEEAKHFATTWLNKGGQDFTRREYSYSSHKATSA